MSADDKGPGWLDLSPWSPDPLFPALPPAFTSHVPDRRAARLHLRPHDDPDPALCCLRRTPGRCRRAVMSDGGQTSNMRPMGRTLFERLSEAQRLPDDDRRPDGPAVDGDGRSIGGVLHIFRDGKWRPVK